MALFPIEVPRYECFLVAFREMMCWMDGRVLESLASLPKESQFLLFRENGSHHLLIPLLDGGFRAVFEGIGQNDQFNLRIHSDDESIRASSFNGFYYAAGANPYALVKHAAKDIADHCGEVTLRSKKSVPDFARKFGWCTYNAFYEDLSHDKLIGAITTFKEKDISLGFVVIDAGWARQGTNAEGRNLLFANEADTQKFPDGISPTVQEMRKLGVGDILAWIALAGYWHGADENGFPEGLIERRRGIRAQHLQDDESDILPESATDATVGPNFVPLSILEKESGLPRDWDQWYDDLCETLTSWGIDGIKIDAMAWVELFAKDRGGRARIMKDLVRGVEAAAAKHMNHQVLYCSSCSNDYFLQADRACVTRTSTDYFPKIPESHGAHVAKNAIVGFFTGEWVLPDWDMFQSHETAGAFHAAARALSGGPVYTADIPEQSDPAILSALAFPDGSVPLCTDHARPVPSSLYQDYREKGKIYTIYNTTPGGGVILNAMNCTSPDDRDTQTAREQLPLAGIPAFAGDCLYTGIARQTGEVLEPFTPLKKMIPVALNPLEFQIFQFAPIIDGFAAFGLLNLYNIGGGIRDLRHENETTVVDLAGPGTFAAYSRRAPRSMSSGDKIVSFTHDPTNGLLLAKIEGPGRLLIRQ
jgi:raffinose synthase